MTFRSAALACVVLAILAGDVPARAGTRDGEGLVAILPMVRWGARPSGLDNRGFAPALVASFGMRPTAATELAIELGGTLSGASRDGGRFDFTAVPLLLRGSVTPLPDASVRPVLHAGVGKELLLVYGPGSEYQEHTPTVLMAAVGLQADLSDALGLQADAGYLHARASAPGLGTVDGGGVFVRAGLYFRWDPVRRLGR